MSKIKVNSLEGVGASTPAISIDNSSGTCTANITNNLSNRNKVINGSMIVDQRNSGSASTAIANNYCVDRFRIQSSGQDQLAASIQQIQSETDAPAGSGLTHHLKWTTTTPETSIDNDEIIRFQYHIEGGDLQDFCYGTSSAKTVTVSFYVKTSVTGVYGFSIYRDESTDRIINRTYTVSNTDWNRYTFTIAGDTASKITSDTASRWRMIFTLAAGSNYTGSSHATWGNYSGAYFAGGHAQNGVCTTNSATWQLTGVQLEVGSVATDFEHLSFADELRRCMRYFYKVTKDGTDSEVTNMPIGTGVYYTASDFRCILNHPVEMRAAPTLTSNDNSASYFIHFNSSHDSIDRLDSFHNTKKRSMVRNTAHASGTQGYPGLLHQEDSNSSLTFSAEL